MAPYVLVHGAWHGGWCWRRVLPLLRAGGAEAFAVTLTGLGERAHLLSASIRVRTHVEDVLQLIDHEELDEVVLVGHSYGGLVITAVADALLARGGRPAIRHLVYVDGVTPHPGESWSSQHPPETIAARIAAGAASGGVLIAAPDASAFGVAGADRDWVNRRLTPQPFGVYQDPVTFDAARIGALPRTFIDCTSPPLPAIAAMRVRVRCEPGWRLVELATGHDPMVTEPAALAALLLELGSGLSVSQRMRHRET